MKWTRWFAASSAALAATAVLAAAAPAYADTIAWTKWTSATPSNDAAHTPGSATGTVSTDLYGTITVTYSGQNLGLLTNYPSWGPTSTFTGGEVGNPPPAANNALKIVGGQTYTETITFSQPVADPIFAIWSLGSPIVPAYFDFNEPFNVLGGGRSNEYGGTGLVDAAPNIFGHEGNGIIQFIGTYTTISFTTPDYENYYALTFGENDTLTSQIPNPPPNPSPVPEPSTFVLLATGALGSMGMLRRRFFAR